jgi:hypothetical protein
MKRDKKRRSDGSTLSSTQSDETSVYIETDQQQTSPPAFHHHHHHSSQRHAPSHHHHHKACHSSSLVSSFASFFSILSPRQRVCLYIVAAFTLLLLGYYLYLRSFDEKAVVVDIMQCVHDVFTEHNIPYFLDYGSLLGAIRHKGFIPWDDLIDIDAGVLASDEDRIIALKPVIKEKCGYVLIHRSDVSHLPDMSAFVIRRGAFRVFYNAFTPLYVDITDYEVVESEKGNSEAGGNAGVVLTDKHFPELKFRFPLEKILPVRSCEYEGHTFNCPNDSEWVLEQEYGKDWRTPKHHFRPGMVVKDNQKGE